MTVANSQRPELSRLQLKSGEGPLTHEEDGPRPQVVGQNVVKEACTPIPQRIPPLATPRLPSAPLAAKAHGCNHTKAGPYRRWDRPAYCVAFIYRGRQAGRQAAAPYAEPRRLEAPQGLNRNANSAAHVSVCVEEVRATWQGGGRGSLSGRESSEELLRRERMGRRGHGKGDYLRGRGGSRGGGTEARKEAAKALKHPELPCASVSKMQSVLRASVKA